MSMVQRVEQRSEQLFGIILVNLATFSWATNMVLGRWLRDSIGPLSLAALRFLIAALVLAILLQRQPEEERGLGEDRWWLIGMALTGVILFAPILYLGLRYTTAVNATLINGLGPLVTGLLASLLIGESMSRHQLVGAAVGLAGVVILISGSPAASLEGWGNPGDLITLVAIGLWGLYSVLGRQAMRRRSALSATALSIWLGLPVLLLASLCEIGVSPIRFEWPVILAILYIGLVPTIGGFLAWNVGVQRLGPSGAMVFYNTLPLYGALLGFFFLGEPVGLAHLLGGGLIIGGGLYAAGRPAESEA